MYLYIEKEIMLKKADILGIFNIQYIKNTKEYKMMINDLKEKNSLLDLSDDEPKSFILVSKDKKVKGYILNLSVNTIMKRLD